MSKNKIFLVSVFLLTLGLNSAYAIELTNLSTKDGNDGLVELTMNFSESLKVDPTIVVLDKPSSISIDFPNTKNNFKVKDRIIKSLVPKLLSKDIKRVRIVENRNRLRVIVYTNTKLKYSKSQKDKSVILRLVRAKSSINQEARPFISTVDFRRASNGGGKILLKISGATTSLDTRTEGGSIIVDLENTNINKSIIKHYDVGDFNTTVASFDIYPVKSKNTARVIIAAESGDFDYVAYQRNNFVVIEVKPLTQAQLIQKKATVKSYTGEKISLNFKSIDIRTALNIIAEVSQLDFIISDSVSGTLSLSLNDIPWDEALEVILKTKNLAKRLDGRILRVGTYSEFAAQDKIELESITVSKALAPIRSEFIQINYAKASDIAGILSDEGGGNGPKFLSERGSIIVDERTNTLLVRETSENLTEIRAFITRLDIPIKQVLIESRIVVARDTFADEIGARFGISGADGFGYTGSGDNARFNLEDNQVVLGNSYDNVSNSLTNIRNAGVEQATNPDEVAEAPTLTRGLNFSNPAAGGGSLAISIGTRAAILDLELSAMQMEERGEVISSPRVITVERRQASIQQGVDIPYQESSGSGATTTSFKRASLGMTVTPQITPDNKVIMDLSIQRDSPGAGGVSGVPNIDTRQVTTQVIVPNGDTVILGGIFEQDKRKSRNKVPLFGDIPILGALFRRGQCFKYQK